VVGVDRRYSGVGVRRYDMEKAWVFYFLSTLHPACRYARGELADGWRGRLPAHSR